MKTETVDISKFKKDDSFYGKINLLLTVKSFDLQEIRKRYLESRKVNKSGKVGSVERREAGIGGIVRICIESGKIIQSEIVCKLKEPRGIACQNNILGIAAEKTVYIISENYTKQINNAWFSYIHTLDFSPFNNNRVIISSSGLDCIFEYDLNTLNPVFEWFAWENGFNEATDPVTQEKIILTRIKKESEKLKADGINHKFIENPAEQVLPTAMRAAFINSVVYDKKNKEKILGTFFHKGTIYQIDKISKQAIPVLNKLTTPHGGLRAGNDIMATSTGSGEVVKGNMDNQIRYAFKNLPGKPDYLSDMEWIQNSTIVAGNIITIDSNRNSFVIFNPETKKISVVNYDNNWAIQDMVVANDLSNHQLSSIGKLGRELL